MKVRTAIHPAVWTGSWDATSMTAVLARAAEIGFDHVVVPLRQLKQVNPTALRRVFETHRLSPLNTTGLTPDSDIGSPDVAVRRRGVQRLQTAIGIARDMGSRQINGVIYAPLLRASRPANEDAFKKSAECMGKAAETGERAGVRLAIEIVNRYETNLINTVEQGLAYLRIAAHPNLYLHLDTFHMSIEEADPIGALRRAVPRLGYFELDQSNRGYLREGSLDLEVWLRQVAAAGYDGIVGIEAFSRSTMMPDHADALAIWRDTFDDGDRLAREGFAMIAAVFGAVQ